MRKTLLLALLCLGIAGTLPAATPTTTTLSGRILDAVGNALAGVSISLRGPHVLQPRLATTDARGEYRFPILPPGDGYSLEARAAGFAPVRRNITVALGRDATLNLVMQPMSSEVLSVRAAAPLIDAVNPTASTNLSAQEISALPTTRDFQQLAALAPQAVFDRDAVNPAIGGATQLENDYIIEGVSTRDPVDGSSAVNLTMNFVDEVQVLTSGLPAEYGRAMGGIVNVITKSGGNDFAGDFSAWFNNSAWASQAITGAYRGSSSSDLGHNRRDYSGSLGGPLRRDRVWFFAAIDPRTEVTPLHIIDPGNAVDRREQMTAKELVYAAKLTASISPTQTVIVCGFGNPRQNGGWMVGARPSDPSAAIWTDYSGSRNLTARYYAAIGARAAGEVTAAEHRQHIDSRPGTVGGAAAPFQFDLTDGYRHGGLPTEGHDLSARNAFSVRGSQFLDGHEFRYGIDAERNRFESTQRETDFYFFGQLFVDPAIGTRDVLEQAVFDNSGYGTNASTALFAQDRWQLASNLSVNAGLRWENQTIGSARGAVIGTGRAADGSIVRQQQGAYTFGNHWAPRLGVTWNPSSSGRAKLYVFGGRYFEAVPVHVNLDAMNGFGYEYTDYYTTAADIASHWWNPTGSPLNGNWVPYDHAATRYFSGAFARATPIARGTKLPFEDELTVGGEYQFGSAWVAGARIVGRTMHHVVEDHRVFDTTTPFRQVDYVIDNIGESEFSSEFRRPKRNYTALELSLQRRLSNRWQVMTSFVAARERGDYDGLYDYANYMGAPNATFQIESPAAQENSYGRLRADRPYQFKIHGSYELPIGLTLAEGVTYGAGAPISAFAARRLNGGALMIYLLPRGSMGRLPNTFAVDLHAQQRLPLSATHGAKISMIADVFNATNHHAVLDVDEEYFWNGQSDYKQWIAPSNRDALGNPKFNGNLSASPFYKTATRYQLPRSVQLGLKVSY